MSDFGASFRSARESRLLTVEMVARETRISARYLDAIENEAFDILPGGVFNRGFIRTYATKLGLDPEAKLAEYHALIADEQGTPRLRSTGNTPETRPERRILPIALGALVLVIILYYALERGGVAPDETPPVGETVAATGISDPAPASLAPVDPAPASLAPVDPAPASPAPVDPAPASPAPVEPVPAIPRIVDGAAGTRAGSADNVQILLEAHEPTWIALASDGEQLVEGMILEPGTRRTFAASEVIELRIGNAAGLTLTVNGEQLPSLGADNQVRNLRITPDGFRYF